MKKAFRLLVSLSAVVCAVWLSSLPADAAQVAVTVEKLTLGQGFIVEPTLVTISGEELASKVLTDLLLQKFGSNPRPWKMTGSVDKNFYLTYVKDTASTPNVTQYILDALGGNFEADRRRYGDFLGEFDYSNTSGWMYAVNDGLPGVGASARKLRDGDVMRWQFTIYGLGADLVSDQSDWSHTPPLKTLAKKDKLIWKVAEINEAGNKSAYGASYSAAVDVLAKIDSTQAETDSALAALDAIEPVDPTDPVDPVDPTDP